MKRQCKNCGKDFELSFVRANQQYCNSHCQKMAWKKRIREPKELPLKNCILCGNPFYPKKGKQDVQITCSNICKVERGNLLRKYRGRKKFNLDIVTKQCLHCGKKFFIGKDETIEIQFCSRKCKSAHYHLENRKPWREERKWIWDGNWYEAQKRDGFKCVLCGTEKSNRLHVHHLDGSGEKEIKNHELGNLMTLCGGCHNLFHRLHLVKIDNEWQVKGTILDRLGLKFVIT